jgi:hypothetical protein
VLLPVLIPVAWKSFKPLAKSSIEDEIIIFSIFCHNLKKIEL